jgi:hypothetical protein
VFERAKTFHALDLAATVIGFEPTRPNLISLPQRGRKTEKLGWEERNLRETYEDGKWRAKWGRVTNGAERSD